MREIELNTITGKIVNAAIKLHQSLGPGLLESVYEAVLERSLQRAGLNVQRQYRVAFDYDGMRFDDGLCVDLLVEDLVVVELKSIAEIAPIHQKQVLTYLRLLDLPAGLLMNFGAPTLKQGLRRVINFDYSGSPCLRERQNPFDLAARLPVITEEPHV